MSRFFSSGGQSIAASASTSVLPKNIQGWFPLGLTGLVLLSKGLSRVLQHHDLKASVLQHAAFFIRSNSHIHSWWLEKNHSFDYMDFTEMMRNHLRRQNWNAIVLNMLDSDYLYHDSLKNECALYMYIQKGNGSVWNLEVKSQISTSHKDSSQ